VKLFWRGFEKKGTATVSFKKHVLLLFWQPDQNVDAVKNNVCKLATRYPSVKVKVVNVKKNPELPIKHKVMHLPTVILLKDGREVDRLEDASSTLLEHLFRRAAT